MARSLKGTATQAFWAGTAYLLTNAVFQPLFAGLSDVLGRKPLLLTSIILFTIGTIIACAAQDFTALLAGRSIQGIGGGGIVAMSLIILTDIVPLRFRPKWYGAIQAAWALGTVLGPVIGGLIAQHTTWRWIFYINFPFCGICLGSAILFVRYEPISSNFKYQLLHFDWLGSFLFIGSTTSLLIAISWGGTQKPWDSAATLAPLIIGLGGLAATLYWEISSTSNPFVRRSLFRHRTANICYALAFIQGFLVRPAFHLPSKIFTRRKSN
jgi:MFS family permease